MIRHRASDTGTDQLAAVLEREPRRLVRFTPEINVGHIIQILVLAAGILLGYSKLDTAISLNVQRTDIMEKLSADREGRINTTNNELKADMKDIVQKVGDLKNRIELLDQKFSQRAEMGKRP